MMSDRCMKRMGGRSPLLALALLLVACGGDPPAKRASAPAKAPSVAAPTVPAEPTFAGHVAAIVYTHCAVCHHAGGPAPFTLTSHDDVRDHAAQIAEVTASGYMPPWLPRAGHGEFVGARCLDEPTRATLARWAAQGAPAGDLSRAPAAPEFRAGWISRARTWRSGPRGTGVTKLR